MTGPDPAPVPPPLPAPGIQAPASRHRQARIATSATFAGQGLMLTVLLTHLPQFTDRHHVSEGTITLIVLMITLLAGAGSLLSEVLAAATSSRTALRCGLLVIAAAGVVVALAPELPLFIAGFALYGLGLGSVDAAGNMQALAVQHRYGRSIITSFHAAWSGGAITGALYVAGCERLSISLAGSIVPVSGVVLLVLVLAGPRLLPLDEPGDQRPTALLPGETTDPGTTSTMSVFAAGPLLLIGLAMVCFWAVDSGIANWSTLYLRDVLTAGDSKAALGYAAYQTTTLISRLVGDFAVRRLGAVFTVRAGALVGTTGLLLVVLAPGPGIAIVGFAISGLGLPMIAPLCFSAAGALARAENDADRARRAGADADLPRRPEAGADAAVDSVVARLNVFNYLGSLLGAVLVGGIATVGDLRLGFIVPVLLAAVVLVLARAFAPAEKA
jgi:MFS family permease